MLADVSTPGGLRRCSVLTLALTIGGCVAPASLSTPERSGAALAVKLMDGVGPAGVAWLRLAWAGVLMLLYLAASKTRWGLGHLLTGILLGALNFANIYTYIRAHQSLPGNPALVFSVMNMGVIVLGTLVGAMAFREPLSKLNLLGVLLALGAIFVMVPR